MGRSFGSRTLLAICGALVILFAALAVVQYRWSTRVAAADAQREKEHLDSSASLFATQFDNIVAQSTEFLQTTARSGVRSGERVTPLPKLLGELYYIDIPIDGVTQAQRLGPDGHFAPVSAPSWMNKPHCAALAMEQPPALVAPIIDLKDGPKNLPDGVRIMQTFAVRPEQCLVGLLDLTYVRKELLPRLIAQSFGATAAGDYNFAVVSHAHPNNAVYGSAAHPDIRKSFFAVTPVRLSFSKAAGTIAPQRQTAFYVQRSESRIGITDQTSLDLLIQGVWELDVAHKGLPLAAAFERKSRLDLLLSLGVETLLLATIAFLVVAARRMQRLADQKMQFVAGVSHELRTPVSAIAMLSRNQADGLVAGPERVKQYGELIHQQSRRLNEMVEQTLEYAGIHSGLRRPLRNEVDVHALIEEAVEARREDLAREGFEIEIDVSPDLPPVAGDDKLLRMAFDNLLNNALKYAGSGHWIRVRAEYPTEEREVRISVEDRGAGIDPADQAEIFEPFIRGRAAVEAQIPGSGLGLSLVRSAAEAHRGSVTLVSEPGRGSTFTMHLPV